MEVIIGTAQAVSQLQKLCSEGARLHYHNGAQWYIEVSPELVAIYDTGNQNRVTYGSHIGEKAVKYLKTSSNCTEPNAFQNCIDAYVDLLADNEERRKAKEELANA